jgi:nitrite reductase/ring-hydroxylating ferredoxin subunit
MTDSENCSQHSSLAKDSLVGLSRRNFLSTIAIAAGSLGLTTIASSAQAASKKYKVCTIKDIKIGGASSFKVGSGLMVLVTQPKSGVFRAFSQKCTHEGYAIDSIEGKNLKCQKHGALFDMNTGDVTRGPARSALPKYDVSLDKKSVYVTIKS